MYRPFKITHGLAIGVLAFSGLALSPSALASTLVQARTREVSYGDLNLATRSGDKALLKRINHAAVEACGGYPDDPDLDPYLRFDACHDKAVSNAVHSVNNASVSRLYDRHARIRTG